MKWIRNIILGVKSNDNERIKNEIIEKYSYIKWRFEPKDGAGLISGKESFFDSNIYRSINLPRRVSIIDMDGYYAVMVYFWEPTKNGKQMLGDIRERFKTLDEAQLWGIKKAYEITEKIKGLSQPVDN